MLRFSRVSVLSSTNTFLSVGTCFLFIFSTHIFNAFPQLTLTLITHWNRNECSLKCDSKASTNFFCLLHGFTDRRFVLAVDGSDTDAAEYQLFIHVTVWLAESCGSLLLSGATEGSHHISVVWEKIKIQSLKYVSVE